VIGILKHEMAHQWLDETGMGRGQGRPHGGSFRLACRMLGVPEEFSHASADLQSLSPDWKQRPRDEQTDKLMDKVRKLLALGTSSNEHEALLAMNKVRELYARYDLAHREASQGARRYSSVMVSPGKKRLEAHVSKVVGILVGHFFVQAIYHRMFDPEAGEYMRSIELIGTRENVLMAEYVYHFLLRETEVLLDEIVRKRGASLSRVERKSCRLGILEGFAEKLRAAERPAPASGEATGLSVIGQALQRFRGDPDLDSYIAEIYPRLSTRSGSRSMMDPTAFDAGREAGKSLTLRKPVASSDGNRGGLLPHKVS
jgi:hypothetical protein